MVDEDKRIAYDTALKMAGVEAQIIWAALRVMLGANAFLIALAGAVVAIQKAHWIVMTMSLAGLARCFLWFVL